MSLTSTKDMLEITEKYSAKNYLPLPVVISRGEGIWVWDMEGRKYLDCLSAYSAVNQGHCHPKIVGALMEQAKKLTLTSRAFHNDQMGPFLEKLCHTADMEMALPMNTGAEAVETALKTARKWGYIYKGVPKDKAEIIVCKNNFHGRTITIVGFSSEEQYREGFGPFTPGFKLIEYGSLEALEEAFTDNTVAFMVEPIQGEGGIIVPPEGYLEGAKKICRKNRALFILDEIQTGLGRTGKLFAYQYEPESKPDILILGKALGGGVYPVSAVLSSKEILSVFRPGDHGSTFGGNPLGSAVGKAALEVIIEEELPQKAFQLGDYLRTRLEELPQKHIAEIRGKGLMIGIEIKKESGPARPFCEKLMEKGVLVKETHEQVIRLAPPLIIQKEELDIIVDALKEVLS